MSITAWYGQNDVCMDKEPTESRRIGNVIVHVNHHKGRKAVRPRRPIRTVFEGCVMMVSLDRPSHKVYKSIAGVFVWMLPHRPITGRLITRHEWKGTGIGVKTIESLNALDVWTVEELAMKEQQTPGWINRLSGISDDENKRIKERLEELL